MVRKKVEGDEAQRRRAALDAGQLGIRPSALGATTGASKQRGHLSSRSSLTHEEKIAPIHRGKQRREAARRGNPAATPPTGPAFPGRGRPEYNTEHERVFQALSDAEQRHGGEAVFLQEVARTAGLPAEHTQQLLHDLVTVHRLATELQGVDRPDLGPRYETKPGR